MGSELVLVTGGSGFIGSHTVVRLLAAGHRVRTTVRSPHKEQALREMVREGGADDRELEVVVADLQGDDGWVEAVAGCAYVVHVASPTLQTVPKHEDEMVVPAREGALRVLRAARDAGVRRVVLTSSFGAIGYGHPPQAAPFTEEDWTDVDAGVPIYQKSKALAERACWDFIAREGGEVELAVVNPVGVLGPVLGKDYSPSIRSIQNMLAGTIAGCPRLTFSYVDVRDVADLHVRAMTDPAAAGERFLASSGDPLSLLDIATVLRTRLGAAAAKAPTRELPNWLVRLAALRNPQLRILLPQLGRPMSASGEKARRVLGWTPRSNEDSIADTGESLVRHGLVREAQPV